MDDVYHPPISLFSLDLQCECQTPKTKGRNLEKKLKKKGHQHLINFRISNNFNVIIIL